MFGCVMKSVVHIAQCHHGDTVLVICAKGRSFVLGFVHKLQWHNAQFVMVMFVYFLQ